MKTKKKRIPFKERWADWKSQNAMKLQAGMAVNEEWKLRTFIGGFDKVKQFFGVFMFVLAWYLLTEKQFIEGFMMMGFVWIHVFLNAVWTKFKGLEKVLDRMVDKE